MNKQISIHLVDTGDNHPISYTISNRTTVGFTVGWHLVELKDNTFSTKCYNCSKEHPNTFEFRYDMIDKFIEALNEIKRSNQSVTQREGGDEQSLSS